MTRKNRTQPKPAINGSSPGLSLRENQDSFDYRRLPCDLHVHTTASDGLFSPAQVVEEAKNIGLGAIAICDHDTVSGLLSLKKLFFDGFHVVEGVEINSQFQGREVHILGYFVPLEDNPFLRFMKKLKQARCDRIEGILEKLKKMGKPLELSQVLAFSKGDSIGRPHVAQAMVEKGYTKTVKEAFQMYLGIGRPAYVERARLEPKDSVKVIRESGGVPVWAHPGNADADFLIDDLVDAGLLGLEVYHPDHDEKKERKYLEMATQKGLVVTGGSDFHGPKSSEGGELGQRVVPYETVEKLKALSFSGQ